MNEEIIIDGVNVFDCKNYFTKDGSCMSGDTECTLCRHNSCYYKDFKCLEQENKELKERLAETKQFFKDTCEENAKLCQQIEAYKLSENEAKEIITELKHNNKQLLETNIEYKKEGAKLLAELNALKIGSQETTDRLLKVQYQLADDCKKYEQALEEIREIINEQKPPLDKAISQSEFTLERLCVYEEKYIKVVDKINEVLK